MFNKCLHQQLKAGKEPTTLLDSQHEVTGSEIHLDRVIYFHLICEQKWIW